MQRQSVCDFSRLSKDLSLRPNQEYCYIAILLISKTVEDDRGGTFITEKADTSAVGRSTVI